MILYISVSQNGIEQFSSHIKLRWYHNKLYFGGGKSCHVPILFEKRIKKIPIFQRKKNKIVVLKNALVTDAKIEGLDSDLKNRMVSAGEEGVVCVLNYVIRFHLKRRLSSVQPKKVLRPLVSQRRVYFPPTDTPLEQNAIGWSLCATCLMVFSAFYWVSHPAFENRVLKYEAPYSTATEFIAPEHFLSLPFIFQKDYNPYEAPIFAMAWVTELVNRFEAADAGEFAASSVDLLRFPPYFAEKKSVLQKFTGQAGNELWFSVIHSGIHRLSLYQRIDKRIQQIQTANSSVGLYEKKEESFLKLKEEKLQAQAKH